MDLSALIDNSGINKHRITELAKKLPDIYDSYDDKFKWVQMNRKPRDIVAFCLQSFGEICLKIWNDSDKETERLRHEFVRHIINKILDGERLSSKPGPFNWALLYPTEKDTKDKSEYDPNTSEERGDDDKGDEDERDENYGDSNEAFAGIGDLDMEDDGSDEYDNDANNINVDGID
jgi:hypothetical protein